MALNATNAIHNNNKNVRSLKAPTSAALTTCVPTSAQSSTVSPDISSDSSTPIYHDTRGDGRENEPNDHQALVDVWGNEENCLEEELSPPRTVAQLTTLRDLYFQQHGLQAQIVSLQEQEETDKDEGQEDELKVIRWLPRLPTSSSAASKIENSFNDNNDQDDGDDEKKPDVCNRLWCADHYKAKSEHDTSLSYKHFCKPNAKQSGSENHYRDYSPHNYTFYHSHGNCPPTQQEV